MPKFPSLKASLKTSLLKEDFRIGGKVFKEVSKEANLVMWIYVFFEEWALILEQLLFHGIAKKVSKKIWKKISKKILKKENLASESGPCTLNVDRVMLLFCKVTRINPSLLLIQIQIQSIYHEVIGVTNAHAYFAASFNLIAAADDVERTCARARSFCVTCRGGQCSQLFY